MTYKVFPSIHPQLFLEGSTLVWQAYLCTLRLAIVD